MSPRDEIDFGARAKIYMLEGADEGSRSFKRGGQIWEGTLGEAIDRVMAMSPDEQERASIIIDENVVTGTSLLYIKDIRELHQLRRRA